MLISGDCSALACKIPRYGQRRLVEAQGRLFAVPLAFERQVMNRQGFRQQLRQGQSLPGSASMSKFQGAQECRWPPEDAWIVP